MKNVMETFLKWWWQKGEFQMLLTISTRDLSEPRNLLISESHANEDTIMSLHSSEQIQIIHTHNKRTLRLK